MPKYSLAFGPNGEYFFSTSLGWTSLGLPETLRDKLYTDVQASKLFVSLGPDGQYFYSRQTGRGNSSSWILSKENQDAATWIRQAKGLIQFTFGPDNTFVGCTSQGATRWSAADSSNVQRNVKGFHPVMATLGVDDSYVFVDGSGRFKWNLKGRYDQLDQILTNSRLAIEMVAINPYAKNQYLIIFKNGTWRACLPTSYMEKVKDMLQNQNNHDAQLMSIALRGVQQNHQIAMNAMQNMATMSAVSMINNASW